MRHSTFRLLGHLSSWSRVSAGLLVGCIPLASMNAQLNRRLVAPPVVEMHDGSGTSLLVEPKYVRMTVAPNGTAFLLQPFTPVIQRFSANSGAATEIGRKGRGPGEYLLPAWMGLVADTLWIFDVGNRRTTLLPSYGAGKATTTPFVGGVVRGAIVSSIAALAPDGSAITTTGSDARLATIGSPPLLPLIRTSRDGSRILDTIAMLGMQHAVRTVQVGADRATRTSEEPFSDKSLWAASPNGTFVAVVTQPDGGPAGDVSLYRYEGTRVYSARIPFPRVAVTPADAQRILNARYDTMLEYLGDRKNSAPSRTEFANGMYMPRFKVPVSDLVVSDDGRVALRGNDWLGDTVDYAWMTPSGAVTGIMPLPRRQHIRVVRGSRLWSIVETDDGELRIVRQDLAPISNR